MQQSHKRRQCIFQAHCLLAIGGAQVARCAVQSHRFHSVAIDLPYQWLCDLAHGYFVGKNPTLRFIFTGMKKAPKGFSKHANKVLSLMHKHRVLRKA